jgi:hypothetical protein
MVDLESDEEDEDAIASLGDSLPESPSKPALAAGSPVGSPEPVPASVAVWINYFNFNHYSDNLVSRF